MPNMELILGLLAAASLLSGVARYVSIPYPVVLVMGGGVLAAIPDVPQVTIAPNVVFLVFLPPLLYSAAVFSSPAELRDNAVGILILAVGLVLATVAAVAVVAHAVSTLSWAECFVLGAILGATDPLAATAIIRRLGAPQRIATLLEGEALVNDGTSLTAFKVAVSAVGAHSFSLGEGALEFVVVSAGGVAIGIVVGKLSALIRSRLDDANLETAIAVLTAYAAYIAADQAGASGVLAAVAAGLVTARSSARIFSPGSRLRSYAFWQTSSFILNALLFLLIGLQLRSVLDGIHGADPGALIGEAAAVIGVLMGLRIAWMYAIPTVIPYVRRRLPGGQLRGSWSEQLVLGWSGMRGALSLAAALSLPLSLGGGGRGELIFLSFAAIFVTLVLPGLTLAPLISALGLGQSARRRHQSIEARLRVIRAALARLDEFGDQNEISERTLARLRDLYETRATVLEQSREDEENHDQFDEATEERRARAQLLDAQRKALRQLIAERAAPTEVLREIERDLDLEATRLPRL